MGRPHNEGGPFFCIGGHSLSRRSNSSISAAKDLRPCFQKALSVRSMPAIFAVSSTLITLAEKQKNYDAYLNHIREYLSNPNLDADDMQLANWTKPFADPNAETKYKEQMKGILRQRINEIKAGKRKAQRKVGNMMLSRPTDELLEMIIDALDGKMPGER